MFNLGTQLRSRTEGMKKMDAEIAKVEARKEIAEEMSTIVDKMPVQLLVAPEQRGVNRLVVTLISSIKKIFQKEKI
jgi:hypothetical protein